MKIIYKPGNLLDTTIKTILHSCNDKYGYASGVAGAIRHKYPLAYETYMDQDELILGEYHIVNIDENRTIINMIGQHNYGRDEKRYVRYDALAFAFEKLDIDAYWANNTPEIAMPLIGAGLGGGSWNIISAIIEDTFTHIQPTVYLLDGKLP